MPTKLKYFLLAIYIIMRNFHEWLLEQEQSGVANPPQDPQPVPGEQPQQTQPQQQQTQQTSPEHQNYINIPPGQEVMFANRLLSKLNMGDYDLKEDFQIIFTTANAYLARSQGKRTGELNNFFSKLLPPLKNTNLGKYLEDAQKQMVQSRQWNDTMPNLLLYEPSWASRSFKPIDPENFFQAFSGLAATIGQLTQGKTQSSIFRGG